MKPHPPSRPNRDTSWDAQSAWYDRLVGEDGSDFHREVILPGTMELLGRVTGKRILDLGCGQGVLCRLLLRERASVVGVDLSESLIARARRYEASVPDRHATGREKAHRPSPDKGGNLSIQYIVADACRIPTDLRKGDFDAATSVLAAGNMEDIAGLFAGAADAVRPGGCFVVIVMHPCYRIPRQSRWEFDEEQKLQYRRIDRYLTPLSIPIVTHPGKKGDTSYTTMFHRPIQDVVGAAAASGWMVDALEEWTSNRRSTGARAKAENRARDEFPLFLALRYRR